MLLLATFLLIAAEDGMEFGWVKHRIFDSYLFLMLLFDMIVLIHKVIYSHISPQINRWQLCLNIDFLCQSFKIMTALFSIKKRVICIESFLIAAGCCEDGLRWEIASHLFVSIIIDRIIQMHKNKKMVTESSRQQKRTLRITQSPKKITKLKLSSILEANKLKEMEQINEAVREKLQEPPNTASRNKGFNPYEVVYQNDLAYWRQYCEATGRYENGGINLKWPYYFTQNHSHSPDKE